MLHDDICRLCERKRPLELSHIIPKFVIRWQRNTAVVPIRESSRPNARSQDGPKLRFLCSECEDRFGKWETSFAANIFEPAHRALNAMPHSLAYEGWGLKFAASVSWRVLRYLSEDPRFGSISQVKRDLVCRGLTVWRRFLLDGLPHPREFEQHVILLGLVEKPIQGLSAWFNRYAERAVDHVFADASEIMFTYSKLGRICIFGMLPPEARVPGWQGTKLRVKGGQIRLRDTEIQIPGAVMDFVSSRADLAAKAMASLSPRQQEKVAEALRRADPDGPLFEAFLRDFQLFGDAAFKAPGDDA